MEYNIDFKLDLDKEDCLETTSDGGRGVLADYKFE